MDNEISKFIHENVNRIKQEKIQKALEILFEMEEQTPIKYHLDITTVETLEDVKTILAGLDLAIYSDDPNFDAFKKYFRIEGE